MDCETCLKRFVCKYKNLFLEKQEELYEKVEDNSIYICCNEYIE